jgi:lipopolysaccharide assembly outer membrane protein LptD (OstA)
VLLAQKQSQTSVDSAGTSKKNKLSLTVTDTIPKDIDTVKNFISDSSNIKNSSNDSVQIVNIDSLNDTGFSKDTIKFPVVYKARDSIVYDIVNSKVYLYGNANVVYDKIDLTAYFIELDWKTNIVMAETEKDSAGNTIDDVIFKEGPDEYKAKKLAYNFTTEIGKVYQVRTKEGEGYMHAEAVKRNKYDEWYGRNGKYTTCDLEHPHFYLHARKMKMVPDKVVVTGPANMVVADIPTPLYIPFGMFPTKKDRKTGIIFPQYGEEANRGFFLRNGGYYFYFNDNIDLALTGDIYTKGSYALRVGSNYAKRYKFTGNVAFQYGRNRLGDPAEQNFSVQNDFKVTWRHTQDIKARPGTSFNSYVNFGSATYDRNFSYSQNAVINSQFNSNISYSKTWMGKPFNFSINGSHSQSLVTKIVDLTFPGIVFGVSRITPFKPKVISAKKKWYESIGFAYRFEIQNQMSGADSVFFKPETLKNARFGIVQNVPISTSFNLFKFITVQPQFNYNERWYFKTVSKEFSAEPVYDQNDSLIGFGKVISDTTYRFKTSRDFDVSTNISTRLYGMVQFKKGKLKAIRHVFFPQMNFRYRPDFGKEHWGYYRDVQTDTSGKTQQYSIFDVNSGYPGIPPRGEVAGLGLTLNNILELKVFSRKDTVKQEKKIKILENLRITSFYNFAADSLRLDPINISGYTTLINGAMTVNFSSTFDPYDTDSAYKRINTFMWESEKRLTRFTNATLTIAGNLRPKTTTPAPTRGSEQEREHVINNLRGYYDFNIPWSLRLNFDLNITKGNSDNPDSLILSAAALRFDFDVNVTKNWKLNITSGYNFAQKDFIYTQLNVIRNLHCWELRFQYTAYPVQFRSYNIQINVKSAVLQELKLSRKQQRFDNFNEF